ncbi:MAG: hypothetical protein AAGI34_12900 [Pseudomonadota bacterium]
MHDDEELGWMVMLSTLGIMSLLVLALLYAPDIRPSEEVLACDRAGGYWVGEEGRCELSNSPLAGLAS